MRKILLFLIVLSVLEFNNLFAQEQNGEVFSGIIGKGVSDNYNQALEYAKRDALERSVGVYISSETIVKNDNLFKEEIYSLSSGFVSKYRIISDIKLSEKITEVIISADISKDAVIEEVKKLGVSVQLNGGGLFDEMIQIKKYEDNEYSLFKSLFSNPSNQSPYTFNLTYDKPVFDDVKDEWTIRVHIRGKVDSIGKAILNKTKNILENASYDKCEGIDLKSRGYNKLNLESSEYKQLVRDYQSKTCAIEKDNGYISYGLLATQINGLNRKPYSPYLIQLDRNNFTVKDVRTFLFLRMFYFFEFVPNFKVKVLGNNGNVLMEAIINKDIRGVFTSGSEGEQSESFNSKFCNKTLNSFLSNYSLNVLNNNDYKRDSIWEGEYIDHEVFRFGNYTNSPYSPILDLNRYYSMTTEYEFDVSIKNSDFSSVSKIEVEGLPVLLKKDL